MENKSQKMRVFILLLLFFATLARGSFLSRLASRFVGYDPHCHATRHGALDCISRYVDTNHDNVVTVREIDEARERYTGWLMRILERMVSWEIDISSAKIMQDCGRGDARGEFTEHNFMHGPASKTCLVDRASLCLFDVACKHVAAVAEADRKKATIKRARKSW